MRQHFLKGIVLPLASKLGANKGWDYYRHYIRADFEPAAQRRERQWQKLQSIVRHAYHHVPFYKRKYDQAGMNPDNIKSAADFRKLPVITKKELREHFPKHVIADNFPPQLMRYSNTSGTTGTSLFLVHDHDDINFKYASKLRSRYLMGRDIGDTIVRLTPNECQPCLPTGESPEIGILKYLQMLLSNHAHKRQAYYIFVERRITNRLLNNRRFPPPLRPDFTDADLLNYINIIRDFKPQIVAGYPLYLYLLAKLVQDKQLRLPLCKGIDLTAGLSTPAMRRYIGEQFSAPVFQSYGGCELGRVASSCAASAGRMHILEEQCYMEFILSNGEPARPGELANIIMTALNSYGMPFIRYEHGDVGEYYNDPCPCQRTTRLMSVEGRLQDLLIAANGVPVPSRKILEAFLGFPGVKLFQLIEHEPRQFDFKFVKENPSADINPEGVQKQLAALLGTDVNVRMQPVDYIRPASSGKYRLIRSASFEPFRCVTDKKRPLGNFW